MLKLSQRWTSSANGTCLNLPTWLMKLIRTALRCPMLASSGKLRRLRVALTSTMIGFSNLTSSRSMLNRRPMSKSFWRIGAWVTMSKCFLNLFKGNLYQNNLKKGPLRNLINWIKLLSKLTKGLLSRESERTWTRLRLSKAPRLTTKLISFKRISKCWSSNKYRKSRKLLRRIIRVVYSQQFTTLQSN